MIRDEATPFIGKTVVGFRNASGSINSIPELPYILLLEHVPEPSNDEI